MMSRTDKNLQILSYIVKERPNSGVTELMKLCYLMDLTSIKKTGKKITDFEYVRYTYGPFSKHIYSCLEQLAVDGVIIANADYTPSGNEYITYKINEENPTISGEYLNDDTRNIIDEVLEVMKGHGAKALTDVAYKTKPMQKLGATLGGDEHLGEVLDLNV